MQKCNVTVRLAGSLSNTVHKTGVTPAEILILRHIHGDDAVVDIRPTEFDKTVRQEDDYVRLQLAYDPQGGFTSQPGEESKSIMQALFPGALRKLPTTLAEIGLEGYDAPEPKAPARAQKGRGAKAIEPPAPVEPEGALSVTPAAEAPTGLNWGATGDDAGDGEGEGEAEGAESADGQEDA